MFSYNAPYGEVLLLQQRHCTLVYWLTPLLQAPRLNKSFMQWMPTIALLCLYKDCKYLFVAFKY